MKLFIQARKDGYNVLYPTPTPQEFYQFGYDIQRNDAQNNALYYGKSVYSIAFTINGCIFSKFIIIYDVQRSSLGNVGISVFIPNTQKLQGADVKKLLDDLGNIYNKNYFPDFYLQNKREDWVLFTSVVDDYDKKLYNISIDNAENIPSGMKDAAFSYYPYVYRDPQSGKETTFNMEDIFNAPYQEEYAPYRQVFFVDKNLQESENPLNAFQHDINANLTGKIDLDNSQYTLFFGLNTNGGVRIDVKANGIPCHNKNKIRRKDELEINYFKQYYKEEKPQGKCYEIDKKYISVDDLNRRVIIKGIDLIPIIHTFTFVTENRNGNKIDNAEIFLKVDNQEERKIENGKITLKEEELQYKCIVSARKGDNLFSEPKEIKIADEINRIVLVLEEYKKVEIIAHEETKDGDLLFNINISVKPSLKQKPREGIIEFIGSEIETKHKITVNLNGYDEYTFDYDCRKDERKKHIYLKKKIPHKQKKYKINAGEYGKKKEGCPDYSFSKRGQDLDRECIKPNKGYKFVGFNFLEESNDGYDGVLVAKYQKEESKLLQFASNPFVWASCAIAIIALIVIIFIHPWSVPGEQTPGNLKQEIENYLKSNDFKSQDLIDYKTKWEPLVPNISNKIHWQLKPYPWIKIQKDSDEYKNWYGVSQRIKEAIDVRKMIDARDFLNLKGNEHYTSLPQEFRIVVDSIDTDSVKYKKVVSRLGDVKNLSLSQIAGSINNILSHSAATNDQSNVPEDKKEVLPENKPGVPKTNEDKKSSKTSAQVNGSQADNKLSAPIQQKEFEAQFWELVHKNAAQPEFFNWFSSGNNISYNNEYKKFYDKYLSLSPKIKDGFTKFRRIQNKSQINDLQTLTDKINQR